MLRARDRALLSLLPSKDSEYSFQNLSEAETLALEAALGDGFGTPGAVGYHPMPTPAAIQGGLLKHSFFVPSYSEYDHEEYADEFWDWRGDQPPPSDFCPIDFDLKRLGLYFINQLNRFSARLIREQPDWAVFERWQIEEIAMRRIYEKPWYEAHAVQLFDWLADPSFRQAGAKNDALSLLSTTNFSGTLGRLVEQYYWRFKFEKAAMTGMAARSGASTGGKAKAQLHRLQHAKWQLEATKIWRDKPQLTKAAVAKLIKARLSVPQTGKHIARFIRRP